MAHNPPPRTTRCGYLVVRVRLVATLSEPPTSNAPAHYNDCALTCRETTAVLPLAYSAPSPVRFATVRPSAMAQPTPRSIPRYRSVAHPVRAAALSCLVSLPCTNHPHKRTMLLERYSCPFSTLPLFVDLGLCLNMCTFPFFYGQAFLRVRHNGWQECRPYVRPLFEQY